MDILNLLDRWDLDIILTFGDQFYTSLGFTHEYLLLGQLPNQLNIDGRTLYVAKSTSETAGVTSHTTDSILKLIPGFNCGIFITCGLSSSFMIENGNVFIFDSPQ